MLLILQLICFLHGITSEARGPSSHACLIRWAILAPATGTASSWLMSSSAVGTTEFPKGNEIDRDSVHPQKMLLSRC